MRKAWIAIGLAVAVGGLCTAALASDATFNYDTLAALNSLADEQSPADSGYDTSAVACKGDCQGTDCSPSCCEPSCCEPSCTSGSCVPWTLPQPCCLQRMGIKLGGWIEQGITLNPNSPQDRFNGPVALNDRSNDYQLNQLWLYAVKPIDNGGCGWDWGGRFDMTYGTDWRYGIGYGLENNINGLDQLYGLCLPQMYGEIAYNNITVRGGRFAGLLGYEQVPSPANFFYSHSYTMCYTEPQLVTGFMVDTKLNRNWLLQAGMTQGWFMWEDVNNHKDFMGALTWTSNDKRTSLKYALVNGNQKDLANNDGENWFAYGIVFQHQISSDLKYVLQHNYGFADDVMPLDGHDAEWYTLCQYLEYKLSKKWAAGMRFEWMRDDDGFRVGGPSSNPDFPDLHTWRGFGYPGNFYEFTLGLNWRPAQNFVVRPECRWDWYNGERSWADNSLPFDDGNRSSQFTFAVDAIWMF